MGALRWILLLAGLLFLAALAAWESRRPRQARTDAPGPAERTERNEPEIGAMGQLGQPGAGAARAEELPESSARIYTGAALSAGRTRTELLPRIDLPPLEPYETADPLAPRAIDEPISAQGPGPAPDLNDAEPYYVYARAEPSDGASAAERPLPAEGALPAGQAQTAEPGALAQTALAGEPPRPAVVDWPPESERHILSVRIASLSHERMSGRQVRLALGACGFEHGRFGIFHQPGADGRALLSAANLSKPGIFDLQNMDFQRFSGLSLFAVLPGPLPPAAALDHLLDTAQDLAERLRARLQDEQGLTLGATQLDALRRTVQDLTVAERAEPTA
jgi:cell division protein ZipA